MKLFAYFQPAQSGFQHLIGFAFFMLAVVFSLVALGGLELGTRVLLGAAVLDALLLPFYFGNLWSWSNKLWSAEDKGTWRLYAIKAGVIFVDLMMLVVLYAKVGFVLNIPFASADHENFAVRECIRILVGFDSPFTQYLQ